MANHHRGEVEFDVAGKSYKLVFSANALCDLEGAIDLGINEISERLSAGRLRVGVVRAALWAGLQQHHPDMTIKDAGNLMEEITATKALELVTRSLQASFPEAKPDDAPNPPQPGGQKDGTGPAS